MAPTNWKRSSTRPKKLENLYKVLGTRANISQERIREKYVEQLRLHPPETHPEEFRRIREAYETLRDPVKRKRYDAQRQGLKNPDELFSEAMACVQNSDFGQAQTLAEQLSAYGELCRLHQIMAGILAEQGDRAGFEREIQQAAATETTREDHLHVNELQAFYLVRFGKLDEAKQVLRRLARDEPNELEFYGPLAWNLALGLGLDQRKEEAWALYQTILPPPDQHTARDKLLIQDIIRLMVELDKWDRKSEVSKRIKSFAKAITDLDERHAIEDHFVEEFGEHYDAGSFRGAQVHVELLLALDRSDPDYREWDKELKEILPVHKELLKSRRDYEIFAGLNVMTEIWFGYEFIPDFAPPNTMLDLMDLQGQMDHFGVNELDLKFELVYSINQVRKRYPKLYKALQADFEAATAEFSEGLNRREQRLARKTLPTNEEPPPFLW